MNAFPMLVRCFEAQWHGLNEEEQDYCDGLKHIRTYMEDVPKDLILHYPIWSVEHIGTPLVSVKLY